MTEERPRPGRPRTAEKTKAAEEEGFLGRWSRRKRAEPAAEPAAAPAPEDQAPEAEVEAVRPEDLPDIDSLDEHSDYTVFLKEGVPEVLKRQALRRLWRSNPVFANLDGLAEYDEDYSDAATLVEGVKSLFKAGKGMREGDEEVPEATQETAQSESAEAEPADGRAEGLDSPKDETAPASAPEQTAQEQAPAVDSPAAGDAAADTHPEEAHRPAPGSAAKRRWGAFES